MTVEGWPVELVVESLPTRGEGGGGVPGGRPATIIGGGRPSWTATVAGVG